MSVSTTSAFIAQKKAMRKAIFATLKTLSASSIQEQSTSVRERILSLPSFQQCRSVSCYLSMPSRELDTSILVREILQLGKRLYVPKIAASQTSESKMDFLRIYDTADLDALPKGLWDIPDPAETYDSVPRANVLDAKCGNLDVILVPGVAFDRSFCRLGHGKGYYDRFIADYIASGRPRPLLVALSLREQLQEEGIIPVEEFDWKMDVIVTPDTIIIDQKQQYGSVRELELSSREGDNHGDRRIDDVGPLSVMNALDASLS